MECSIADIAKATGGRMIGKNPECSLRGVSIDSRTTPRGALFVAIRGAHFDGHMFTSPAVAAGAAAVVVVDPSAIPEGANAIVVADTERALGDIAAWWRSRFSVPCIGITGSNGKSTSKEMIAALTTLMGPTLKTEGNFNNLIGLPLTLFRWESAHRSAVIEMGMNAPGEILRLATITKPSIGLITNVTAAHLEKLGSVEAVARVKEELFDAMGEGTIAIINLEDPWIRKMGERRKGAKITFGMAQHADIQFLHMDMESLDEMKLKVRIQEKECSLTLPVPGAHNVMNALAAFAVGLALGLDPKEMVDRIERFQPMAMRMEQIQLAGGVRLVNDSYNANPGSMRAAFRTVGAARRAGRFIAALGDMLELGEQSHALHREIGAAAAEMGVERLYTVGSFSSDIAEGAIAKGLHRSFVVACADVEDLSRRIEKEVNAGDVVLVKASRGMKMERVVEYLKNHMGTD